MGDAPFIQRVKNLCAESVITIPKPFARSKYVPFTVAESAEFGIGPVRIIVMSLTNWTRHEQKTFYPIYQFVKHHPTLSPRHVRSVRVSRYTVVAPSLRMAWRVAHCV